MFAEPRVLLAVRHANAVYPGVKAFELSSDQFPVRGGEEVGVKYANHSGTNSAAYTLAFAEVHLNMNHVMQLFA